MSRAVPGLRNDVLTITWDEWKGTTHRPGPRRSLHDPTWHRVGSLVWVEELRYRAWLVAQGYTITIAKPPETPLT